MTPSNGLTRAAALALLGLPRDASPRDITQAYRRLAKATHPDRVSLPGATAPVDPPDPAATDSQRRFALLADAYHALASTPENSLAQTPPSGLTPPSDTATIPGAVSIPVRVRRPPRERADRPPIVAGPVNITPSPPPAGTPRRPT